MLIWQECSVVLDSFWNQNKTKQAFDQILYFGRWEIVLSIIREFFSSDEDGQGMVEYGLIVGLIAIIVIAVFVALGPQINSMFTNVVDENSVGEGQASLSTQIYN